jgi:hypothetical protein
MTRYIENKIYDYWSIVLMKTFHPISKYMSRDRFKELLISFRYVPQSVTDMYEKVAPLSDYIIRVNLRIWVPRRDLAIDGAIAKFTGRAKEITTIPNKPTPMGLKIWCCAQRGFLLVWC